ncbi:DNA-processing protein DprA [bacterium]|nr:DNA-processing protein DprA [bacterium]
MKYLNALNKISGVGSQKIRKLIGFFGSAEKAWNAGSRELAKSGIEEKIVGNILAEREKINSDEEWERMIKEDIEMITAEDENYPKLLKEIPNPPYSLYIKGEMNFNSRPMITIVGSRKLTSYGKQAARGLARDLSQAGITIVSGMALGIDAAAHRGALDTKGKTIAVLGSGLDDRNIGPQTNFNLSREIIFSGALVSDYPAGTPALPGSFPARNRIMAGMALGTLVIESAQASGTLITANLALDFNREIFAVPGSIFSPVSEGTNQLIKSGAKPVTCAKDILEELNIEKIKEAEKIKKIIPDSPEEERILKILSGEPLHIDKIIKLSKLKTSVASSTIAIMEMKGMIKNMGGQNYMVI